MIILSLWLALLVGDIAASMFVWTESLSSPSYLALSS